MEHDLTKATRKPAMATKNSDATNFTCNFKGGPPSLGGGMASLISVAANVADQEQLPNSV